MEIKQLEIKNYKSIEHVVLKNVNPFSVFVGANASGKSNVFEAIEFFSQVFKIGDALDTFRLFGKPEDVLNRKNHTLDEQNLTVRFVLNGDVSPYVSITNHATNFYSYGHHFTINEENSDVSQIENFSRLFVGNSKIKRQNYIDDSKLNADASNLELVLKRILKNETIKNDFLEELCLLIPGFSNIEINSNDLTGEATLLIYEKGTNKPFTKNLLSDGTYNIIALLTAVYQSEEPQFICIEEPENGLNPFVAKEFVRIFRDACAEKGHFIWINTHSQSILSELTNQELIIVDKINGATVCKQIQDVNTFGLKLDEALFTNMLGGGTPW